MIRIKTVGGKYLWIHRNEVIYFGEGFSPDPTEPSIHYYFITFNKAHPIEWEIGFEELIRLGEELKND